MFTHPTSAGRRLPACLGALSVLVFSATAQLPSPVVEFSFSETNGTLTTNSGTLGGSGVFAVTQGRPVFSALVPSGAFAPAGNIGSVDFGTIGAGEGGRAIDLNSGTLGAFNAFTVCGWVNARALAEGFGGNRIAFALASPNGPGFDLVQLANGALRIGINQWPDGANGGGPSSSTGKITADANAGAANWVFFAVTYDSSLGANQVKYYFGKPAAAAALDVQANYNAGPVASSGSLSIGNFGAVVAARNELGPSGGARVFRGLVDEVRVYPQALTLAQVQAVQTTAPFTPVDPPPVLAQILPATNTVVRQFTQVEVIFNEAVTGVDAADVLVNGSPATNLLAVAPDEYVFYFPQPATGVVSVAFAAAHGIVDFATNAFAGGSWNYTLDPNAAVTPPIITEFMADNDRTLDDEDGDASDWIELFNPGVDPVNLEGFFLTDDAANLTKWRFPAYTLLPNQFLVVFASQKNRTNSAGRLHTNFRLERGGEFLALVDTRTNVVSSFAPAYPPQSRDISYGRDRVSPEFVGYFAVPTPGAPNSTTGAGISPGVTFSHASGHFTNAFSLTLSTPASNAVIRYILVNTAASAANTNVPGTNSPVYSGPIAITNSVQVRARAFVPGFLPGEPSSETFVLLQPTLLTNSSDLPIVVIHTLGGPDFNTTTYSPAHVSIYEPVRGRTTFTNAPTTTTRAALRVRGNTSANSPKKSWTVELRDEFGFDKDVSLLGMPAESDWVLYGPNNIEPIQIHNPFAYQLARDMGHWAPRTRFVEVYLNTTGGALTPANYHGLYVLTEKIKVADGRIDEPQLDAADTNAPAVTGTYLMQQDRVESGESGINIPPVLPNTLPSGGSRLTYTEPREAEIRSPQRAAQQFYILDYLTNFVNTLNGPNFADPVNGYPKFVNLAPSIDNHMIKVLTFSVDAFNFSSYFYKERNGKLVFGPIWDFDRSLESSDHRDHDPRVWRSAVAENFDFFNWSWWGRMFQDTNFWQLWVDRYQELRETQWSQANIDRLIDSLIAEIREAQRRDVARWPSVTTPRGDGTLNWEVTHMKNWLTNRLHFMDTNFLRKPSFNVASGRITNGFQLEIAGATNPGTQVYFTLDGTDPRLPGGAISPAAQLYSGAVTISSNVQVVARSRNLSHRNLIGPANGNPPANTPWSGPTRAVLVTRDVPVVVTELMYHPGPSFPGDTNDTDQFEYIELRYLGNVTTTLSGLHFTNGIEFSFTGTNTVAVAPGDRFLLVKNRAAFQSRYPDVPAQRIVGEYTGSLDNAGERVTLVGPVGELVLDFTYHDEWYPTTDGLGFSLVIVNDAAGRESWNWKESWRPSGEESGSPSSIDPAPASVASIFINEALTHTDPSPGDAIELFNPTDTAVDIGDWYFSDDFNDPKKFRIPAGTVIGAGGYVVFYQSNSFGLGARPFALGSGGDEVFLFSGNSAGELTGYFHGFDFGAQFNGVSFGRDVISTGEDHFVAQAATSLGFGNVGPPRAPVVISEINYHPPDFLDALGALDNELEEYIELQNTTAQAVPLFDTAFPTNSWRLRDAVEFVVPSGFTMPADGLALVVSFAPTNIALSNWFAARVGLPEGVPVLGPFSGKLDNSSDSVELVRPDAPNLGNVPYVLVDKVRYSDELPWNSVANGFGVTLQRLSEVYYGNDPTNWTAAVPTPGRERVSGPVGLPPEITFHPASAVVVGGQATNLAVSATGMALRFQWRANGTNIVDATNSVLTLSDVQFTHAGVYNVAVFNGAGAVVSSNAQVTVLAPVMFTRQPTNLLAQPGTNLTLSAAAVGTGTLRWQWRFEGSDIPGATNASYSFTNANLTEHHGNFSVVVSDDISSAVSTNARVFVAIRPVVVSNPVSATVLQGGTVTFSVVATGAPPLTYRWLRAGSAVLTNFVPLLVLTNVQPAQAGSYRVQVVNLAGNMNSGSATLTVLSDNDLDGMADIWERGFGFNTNSSLDAFLDLDGDQMINRDEYVAGTNPTNAFSVLKLAFSMTNGLALEFIAQSNNTYSVQVSTNLAGQGWFNLTNIGTQAIERAVQVLDSGRTNATRFYRVLTPQQP